MATLWTNQGSQNHRRAGHRWPSAPYRTVAFLDHVRGRRLVNNATAGWCKYFGKMVGLMNFSEGAPAGALKLGVGLQGCTNPIFKLAEID